MKESFIPKSFAPKSRELIDKSNEILLEYDAQGYDLSLRQLYYQLVARDIIPNNVRSYNNLGSLISDARKAGLVDWRMILDRGRTIEENSHWRTPAEILDSAANSFRLDKWETQPKSVLVMVEKQALEGVLIPVCNAEDVRFLANKGYCSDSTLYRIGKQIANDAVLRKKKPVVIYLGDHDPSGIDMTRDVKERLQLYSSFEVDVQRVALNMDQVERLQPPENPAKQTDSRYESYREQFGESSWELDAIEPNELASIVRRAIRKNRDNKLYHAAEHNEERMILELQKMAEDYRAKED